MKYSAFIFTVFLFTSPLLAQNPSISYLMCDEAKSQLQIHGSFGIDSGSVSIEDTTLGIAAWSDSLIICDLPDSGKGAGGNVQVQTKHGVSNSRVLSIFELDIDDITRQHQSGNYWAIVANYNWQCNWRADIDIRETGLIFPFEVSKTSFGTTFGNYPIKLPWSDTTFVKDSSIEVSGMIDLKKHDFIFNKIIMQYKPNGTIASFSSSKIIFDSTGYIYSKTDSTNFLYSGSQFDQLTYEGYIQFPPNPKSIVLQKEQLGQFIYVYQENHSLIMLSKDPLGSTTASLYSIDGRLLKRTKLDITSPGDYSIDVSDVHTHFAILVLQTESGVITKKILF